MDGVGGRWICTAKMVISSESSWFSWLSCGVGVLALAGSVVVDGEGGGCCCLTGVGVVVLAGDGAKIEGVLGSISGSFRTQSLFGELWMVGSSGALRIF